MVVTPYLEGRLAQLVERLIDVEKVTGSNPVSPTVSSFTLKCIAMITMVVDHVGWLFFPDTVILNMIGRISFPLFAFLIAVGSTKTKNINAYIRRLLLFGVIAQLPYSYVSYLADSDYWNLNILFTLAMGLWLISLIQKKQYEYAVLGFIGLTLLSFVVSYDYEFYGLMMILASYLFLTHRFWGILALLGTTIDYYLLYGALGLNITVQLFAIAGIIPILFYNSTSGSQTHRLLLYFFYPLHLAVLALVFHLL